MTSTFVRVAPVAQVLATLPSETQHWLSPSESERLARLRLAARREHWLAGHWLARCLLAAHVGGEPITWRLDERVNQPPAVCGGDPPIQLSLSHSGTWIGCALSLAPIGIDLEQRTPARSALHRFEKLLLAEDDQPGTLSTDALLERWVAKEAWVKRQHLSALPEQLAAIALSRADALSGDVQTLACDDYLLGIAADRAHPVALDVGDQLATECRWWRLRHQV